MVRSDGCSGGMTAAWCAVTGRDPPWEGCCIAHDYAYSRGGTRIERFEADQGLRACVTANGHPIWAAIMYYAVRFFGHPYWRTRWRWGYGDPTRRGYEPARQRRKRMLAADPARVSAGRSD